MGGHVSAPGGRILSTVGSNISGRSDYELMSGTSMAAPHVAGLASYLLALDDKLTVAELRGLLTGAAYTRTAALADVDDGTADGNLRVDPVTGSTIDTIEHADKRHGDGHVTMQDFRAWRDAYLQVHANDFTTAGFTVSLDGGSSHFKDDLNMDGCANGSAASPAHPSGIPAPPGGCAGAPAEDIDPRYDLNGDGRIGPWHATAPFKVDPEAPDPDLPPGANKVFGIRAAPGFLRDIDVMADIDIWEGSDETVFADPAFEGFDSGEPADWRPWRFILGNRDTDIAFLRDIPDLIHSFDMHVEIH